MRNESLSALCFRDRSPGAASSYGAAPLALEVYALIKANLDKERRLSSRWGDLEIAVPWSAVIDRRYNSIRECQQPYQL
jgi:hypothetical protein